MKESEDLRDPPMFSFLFLSLSSSSTLLGPVSKLFGYDPVITDEARGRPGLLTFGG